MDRDIAIIPYINMGEKWTLHDRVIESFWTQMIADGTVKRVFNEGEVTSLEEFIRFLQSPTHNVFTLWTDKPCAFAWLDAINWGAYWANFCVFSFAWGELAVELGEKMVDYWYGLKMDDGKPLVSSLAGITPENNSYAVKYIEKIGGKIIGTVPGIVHDVYKNEQVGGVISYIGRNNNGKG